MTHTASRPSITGDITVSSEVTVNSKGGSVTATLKKPLRDRLGGSTDQLSGAALQFGSGQTVVILAGGMEGSVNAGDLHVRRIGRNRFEIDVDDDGAEQVDAVTAAFLRLKKDQFEKGQLHLSKPATAEEWREKTAVELLEGKLLMDPNKGPMVSRRAGLPLYAKKK